MSKQNIVTHQLFDARKLPDGVVAVCEEYGPAPSNKHNASWEYRAIDAAWKAGHIEMWKCARHPGDRNGVKYVFPADAERAFEFARNVQRARRTPESISTPMTPEHFQAAITALGEISNGIAVLCDEVRHLRTDMAAAVELLAKQPKTAHQELVSTFESNGFHQ